MVQGFSSPADSCCKKTNLHPLNPWIISPEFGWDLKNTESILLLDVEMYCKNIFKLIPIVTILSCKGTF